jgi:hypothetical protein
LYPWPSSSPWCRIAHGITYRDAQYIITGNSARAVGLPPHSVLFHSIQFCCIIIITINTGITAVIKNQDNSVGTVTRLCAGWPGIQGLIPSRGRIFSLLHIVMTDSGVHPILCLKGTEGPFSRAQSWLLTPSSVEVKNAWCYAFTSPCHGF